LSIGAIIGGLFGIGTVAVLVWIFLTRRSRIWLRTLDEVAVVKELMFWAAPKVPGRTGHMLYASALCIAPFEIARLQSMSREDLAVLAPFVDEWVEGRLPPQNLPAEYEDFRPRTLLAFRQRLQSEGLWPVPGA
jgi:hypothetical protein